MELFLLKESLEPCPEADFPFPAERSAAKQPPEGTKPVKTPQYAAVLTSSEWAEKFQLFGMNIEQDLTGGEIASTKAEVNYGSLTGSFLIPDRDDLGEKDSRFSFALDAGGIVFIDDSGKASQIIEAIASSRHSKRPCLERFLYDFLETIISKDLRIMESIEKELDDFESRILAEEEKLSLERINQMRSQMRELRIHYAQLIDMTQELEENENGFFKEKDLNYLHLFMNRMMRLDDIAASVREHTSQVRELYQTQLDVRQNRTMTLLTVVTTVFMPLTLITGWYGMNFRYMPELDKPWAYPAVFVLSLVIAVGCLIFFKKKKWM